jgi:hypothetical protein
MPEKLKNNLFHSLPLELRQDILRLLSCPASLLSATLGCHTLYLALMNSGNSILRDILVGVIGNEVLPEAFITYKVSPPYLSTNVKHPTVLTPLGRLQLHKYVEGFVDSLKHTNQLSIPWYLADATAVFNFHVTVFLPPMKEVVPVPLGPQPPARNDEWGELPPSDFERARLQRAIYRSELFRKLFGYLHGNFGVILCYSTALLLKTYIPRGRIRLLASIQSALSSMVVQSA